jgi:hypothetical protein
MMLICPHDGHAVDPMPAVGPDCSRHGVPWFTHCSVCVTPWPLLARDQRMSDETEYRGDDFCSRCTSPAPWLSRPRLLAWVRDQLKASAPSGDVPRTAALELIEALKRLDAMDADDTKTVAAWKKLREVAPKVWTATKPVRDVLIGAAVKRLLEP